MRHLQSFIVVRPPPSKSNHPLNLQVQLVPPSNKDKESRSSRPSSRHSIDSTAESEVSLSRTASNRSETSLYSSYSTGSFSTLGSSSSTSSGRRMIIPLYNLQAHNVMQNVIVDAGTDAKIAKFMKRGLEVIGLAVLEPIEIWSGGSLEDDGRPRTSYDRAGGLQLPGSTPTSSAVSLASQNTQDHPIVAPPPPPTISTPPTSSSSGRPGTPRKFFGKLFSSKKKESPSASNLTPPTTPASPVPSLTAEARISKRSSLLSAHGHPILPGLVPEATLQPPVLGIQPALRSGAVPPRGRPQKYVWVVRKWLKGEPESMLGGMRDRFNEVRSGTLAPQGGLEANVEVRLEWSRGRKRGEAERLARKGSRRRSGQPSSGTPSTASLQQPQTPMTPTTPMTPSGLAPKARKARTRSQGEGGRPSLDSVRSVSPGPTASITTGESNTQENQDDDGGESDPEDSETPWTCTLVVRRLHSHAAVNAQTPTPRSPLADEQPQSQSLRVKVAAVVPTPHHPKVVALLKVPFPLPDVEVERVALRRRIVTPAGISRPAPDVVPESAGSGGQKKFWPNRENGAGRPEMGRSSGVTLTAEEIKDVVSCTGLWLVVREGFGGVGRERRKGDGWRLRG